MPSTAIAGNIIAILRAVADLVTFGMSESLITAVTSAVSRKRPLAATAAAGATSAPSLLIVGLGNPGTAYAATRHNAGTMLVERLAASTDSWSTMDGANVAQVLLGDTMCVCAAPLSFMNLSGRPVAALAKRYELPASSILVLHDDLDLAAGRIKMKQGGSTGGHNGLSSIAQHLRSPDFHRLRIGIGRPADRSMVPDFVLEPFERTERKALDETFDRIVALAPTHLPGSVRSEAARSSLLNALQNPWQNRPAASAAGKSGGGRKKVSAVAASAAAPLPATNATDRPQGEAATPVESGSVADGTAASPPASASTPAGAAAAAPAAAREASFGATSLAVGLPGMASDPTEGSEAADDRPTEEPSASTSSTGSAAGTRTSRDEARAASVSVRRATDVMRDDA